MIEPRKLIVFLCVAALLIYMIWMNFYILKKFKPAKFLLFLMIVGLGLITLATFLDMISNLIDLSPLIKINFTMGAVIFVTFIILWTNSIKKTIYVLYNDSHTDPMTGTYNRKGLEEIFVRQVTAKELFYVMVFDLDRTKEINDNFGHLSGDKYIMSAASIISRDIGIRGILGRTGGDEFVALIGHLDEEGLEEIKSNIKKHVSRIFHKKSTSVSIGHSKYGKDGHKFKELLDIADKNMYSDKRKLKNGNASDI